MAGFEQMMGDEQPPATGAPQGPADNRPAATPEQQAAYNKFVSMGMLLLFDEKTMERSLMVLRDDPNLIEAVAKVASGIVVRLYTAARQQQEEIDPTIVLSGGWEILSEVADMAGLAGIGDLSPEDRETAFYMAADLARNMMEKQGIVSAPESPDEAVEAARRDLGDDGLQSVIARIQGVQESTRQALMGQASAAASAQQGAAQ